MGHRRCVSWRVSSDHRTGYLIFRVLVLPDSKSIWCSGALPRTSVSLPESSLSGKVLPNPKANGAFWNAFQEA